MDSDPICFQDLNSRQKLFEAELEDLVRIGNEKNSKIILNVVPLNNKRKLYFKNVKELSNVAKQQQTEEFTLLKEQNEGNKHIANLRAQIQIMEETLQKLKNEESLGKDEIKQIKKPLLKAIQKYSTNFNLAIELKKRETETLVASVKFLNKQDSSSVDFLINRKDRIILDFDANGLFSRKETQELKNNAQTRGGLNIELILGKLRDRM